MAVGVRWIITKNVGDRSDLRRHRDVEWQRCIDSVGSVDAAYLELVAAPDFIETSVAVDNVLVAVRNGS